MTLPVDYVLVSQRPDEAGAVTATWSSDFAACCSAFSASTTSLEHPTPPVKWALFQVHMTAKTAQDAVRLRQYTWTQRDGVWDAPSVYSAALAPALLDAPRTVGFYLSAAEFADRPPGDTHYVLEVRGAPVIYGAKLRVVYEVSP